MLWRVEWGKGVCVQNSAKLAHTHTLSNICNYGMAWITQMTNKKYNHAKEIQFVANILLDKIFSNCTPSVGTPLHLVVITDGGGVGGVAQALADILAEDLAIRVGYN